MIAKLNEGWCAVRARGVSVGRGAPMVLAVACLVSTLSAGCYVEPEAAAPAAQGEVVVADPPPPPPPVVEPPPPPAPPDSTWVAGYHRWDGHKYQWQAGHYERRPRPNARYEAGHWEARGNGKAWVEGRWN